ncbi:membrane dipeptidase [Leucobacter luti]|uniref:Membrane dipeptidase n=1 Tax=Leucobacter luti TaxID=340320 RepID=A0A4V6PVR9_9MICO|nr:membrane dipeptidase [Leucobacter luti]TDP95438.1 membrane dipeptidase [Leucobacter luti]
MSAGSGATGVIDGLQCGRYDAALLSQMRDSGVRAVTITASFWEDAMETMDVLTRWNDTVRNAPDVALIARTGADIDEAVASNRIAIVLGTQNSSLFNDRIGFVEHFWNMGVRIVQLTYNIQNAVGSSCYEPHDSGLSRFGHEIVEEMNRVGMLVDLSHVGERTSLEAIIASSRPVIINHANARSIYDHARNKGTEVLDALVARGGVLGVCTYNNIAGDYAATLDGSAELIAKHVELLGVDHVAYGSDLDPNAPADNIPWMRQGRWSRKTQHGASRPDLAPPPEAWIDNFDFHKFGAVRDRIVERGLLTSDEAEQVFYGNWKRVYDEGFVPLDAQSGAGNGAEK